MKKILVLAFTICLMVTALCITASAADAPADGIVLRVSADKRDGSNVVVQDYSVFEDG